MQIFHFTVITYLLLAESSSASEINPLQYNIFQAVSFDGSTLTNTSSGCIERSNVRLQCLNGKLNDGDIGPLNSISGNLGEFFVFSRQSGDNTGRITFTFAVNNPVSRAVIYFFNSPNDSIGLPMIGLYGVGSQPLSYVFNNNDDLRQNDSQLRNITLNIQKLTTVVQLDFIFNTSIIDWLLVSEVKFYNGAPISPSLDTIDFHDGPSLTVTLDLDQSSVNLSCTVVTTGSFEWQWFYNENALDIPGCTQVWIGDATRTSILSINELDFIDVVGKYKCVVRYTLGAVNSTKTIDLRLQGDRNVTVPSSVISAYVGDVVVLTCHFELHGCLTHYTSVQWNHTSSVVQNDSVNYDIVTNHTNSTFIISQLTIRNVSSSDMGNYRCRILRTYLEKRISLNILSITTYTNTKHTTNVLSTISTITIPTNTLSLITTSTNIQPTSSMKSVGTLSIDVVFTSRPSIGTTSSIMSFNKSTSTTLVSINTVQTALSIATTSTIMPTATEAIGLDIVIGTAVAMLVVIILLISIVIILLLIIIHEKKKQKIDTYIEEESEHDVTTINEDTVYSIINKDVPPEVPPQLFDDIDEYDSISDLYQLNGHLYDYVIANNEEVFNIQDKPNKDDSTSVNSLPHYHSVNNAVEPIYDRA